MHELDLRRWAFSQLGIGGTNIEATNDSRQLKGARHRACLNDGLAFQSAQRVQHQRSLYSYCNQWNSGCIISQWPQNRAELLDPHGSLLSMPLDSSGPTVYSVELEHGAFFWQRRMILHEG